MGTIDSTNRCSTIWPFTLLAALAIAVGCGGAPGELGDGFEGDACALEGECDDAFVGNEGFDDGGFDGEETPADEVPADAPVDVEPEGADPDDEVPPSNDPGRGTAGSPPSSGGRTPAPQPDMGEGRGAPPPNSAGGREPITRGGPGTYDPSSTNPGSDDPVLPNPECTPGESRCVAGSPGVVEQCGATGFWTTVSCGTAELCTDSACTLACDLSEQPSDAYVCYVPNADGVNDGILWVSNAEDLMENGTLTGVRVHYRSDGRTAPIRRVPDDIFHGGAWPYEWKIDSAGQLRQALIEFRLDQFSHLVGSFRTVDFTYWARRKPTIVVPDATINYETRALAFASAAGPEDSFDTDSSHVLSYAYFPGEISTYSIPGVFGVNGFDHQGGVNRIGIQIEGDGTGTPPMDAFVNFVMLTVR